MGSNDQIFSFIHLSDPHIPKTREDTINGVSPYEKLEKTIVSITQLEYKPKFAIITGDLSQQGTIQGYKLLKQYIKKLEEKNIPTLLTLGNNDNRANFRKVFKTPKDVGPHYYSTIFDGIQVLVLDSSVPGKRTGYFMGDQLDWLQGQLESNPRKPTIIAFHHPIHQSFLYLLDNGNYEPNQRTRFYEIIKGRNILAILNGHLHHFQSTILNDVLHCQASSTYAELVYNDEEFWVKNTLNYNQFIVRNETPYVKNITVPQDGRVIRNDSITKLLE